MAKLVSVPARLTQKLLKELDELVERGLYPNRSEAIRDAVRQLVTARGLNKELEMIRDMVWGLYGE